MRRLRDRTHVPVKWAPRCKRLGQTQHAKDEKVIDRHSLCAHERLSLKELEWASSLMSRACCAFILSAQHFPSTSVRKALKQGCCNTSFLYAYLHQTSPAVHVAPGVLHAYTTINIQLLGPVVTHRLGRKAHCTMVHKSAATDINLN